MDHEQVLDFLGSIPILQQLPGSSIKKIAEVVKLRKFSPGQHIVREGEVGEGLYFIWNGEAEVPPSEHADAGHTLYPLTAGDYFGYASSGPVKVMHKADVIACNELTCLVLCHEYGDLLSPISIWSPGKEKDITNYGIERILELDSLEVDIFRATTSPGSPTRERMFGGQLIGQALAAASKSVDPSLVAHSLHSYFLRGGDTNLPVLYNVQRVRDGHSFATRIVNAVQQGHVVFTMAASFQRAEEGVKHYEPMPIAPDPEKLKTWEQLMESYRTDPRIPADYRKRLLRNKLEPGPLDIRLCDPEDKVKPTNMEPRQKIWLRARGILSDDQALQRCVAAYASDWIFLETAVRPHRKEVGNAAKLLSLDHSVWFHNSFRADDWLLYVVESPCASNARGLVMGHMYTRSGELVVSVAQEGLIRRLDKAKVKLKSKI